MKWKNNLTIILIILALVMALIFLDVAVLVALKMQSEAAREPEVYRVIVMTEPETQTEPEAAETAQAPDLPEQDAAAENGSERNVPDFSLPRATCPSRCTRYLATGGEDYDVETESIDGAAPVFEYTEQDVHDLAVSAVSRWFGSS